ncbi:hypothetical protein MMC14_006831 [Varicellaria rhodocarpa]|nr:hypothetical protein [Varicellaria rhodocarpa]
MEIPLRSHPQTPSTPHRMAYEKPERLERFELQADTSLESPFSPSPTGSMPSMLASRYPIPHSLASDRPPRSRSQQRIFEARKVNLMRTMTLGQIETRYEEVAKKINDIVETDRKKNEEIDREIEKLEKQREMERKLFWKMKMEYEKKNQRKRDRMGREGDEAKVKEEGEA